MKDSKGGKPPTVLPSYNTWEAQQPACEDDPKGARVQSWPAYLGGNQQLSDWTEDPLNKRESMPDTGDLAKYPGLVKLWLSEENL